MKDKERRPSKKNSKKENKKHPYKKTRKNRMKQKHGIDCPCNECQKIRTFLKKKEKKGEIYLGGLEEDKEKIRR